MAKHRLQMHAWIPKCSIAGILGSYARVQEARAGIGRYSRDNLPASHLPATAETGEGKLHLSLHDLWNIAEY